MEFSFPLFTNTPSRVVQFMNFVDPIDLVTEEQLFEIREDFVTVRELLTSVGVRAIWRSVERLNSKTRSRNESG